MLCVGYKMKISVRAPTCYWSGRPQRSPKQHWLFLLTIICHHYYKVRPYCWEHHIALTDIPVSNDWGISSLLAGFRCDDLRPKEYIVSSETQEKPDQPPHPALSASGHPPFADCLRRFYDYTKRQAHARFAVCNKGTHLGNDCFKFLLQRWLKVAKATDPLTRTLHNLHSSQTSDL